jgi:hypothetical protein
MPAKTNLHKAIKKLEAFIDADQREGLRTLLCTLIIIKVVSDEKQIENQKLMRFISKHLCKMTAGANEWETFNQEMFDGIRANANSVAEAYLASGDSNFREFIKLIGAAGIADSLGPEGRGDLSFGLIAFNELTSRVDSETYDLVSEEILQIIINQLECEELIDELSEVAKDFVDKIESKYEQYS